ncbi:hypothetical protein GE061_003281 [Apolygus lucorum]|uniref:Uncharacterized protein n=1 Tax=Apolygus lucorum TaxID=248454 RepID=A0A8S9X5N5_APOLU|nr:hypothetical protein GE061_003281 [Apolygus lucorum]
MMDLSESFPKRCNMQAEKGLEMHNHCSIPLFGLCFFSGATSSAKTLSARSRCFRPVFEFRAGEPPAQSRRPTTLFGWMTSPTDSVRSFVEMDIKGDIYQSQFLIQDNMKSMVSFMFVKKLRLRFKVG